MWNLTRDQENENLRSIVIAAEPGKIFSAGHNLKELVRCESFIERSILFFWIFLLTWKLTFLLLIYRLLNKAADIIAKCLALQGN